MVVPPATSARSSTPTSPNGASSSGSTATSPTASATSPRGSSRWRDGSTSPATPRRLRSTPSQAWTRTSSAPSATSTCAAPTQAICNAVDALNRDLETTCPWELIRLAAPANAGLTRLLRRYLASVRVIAAAVRPIAPDLAARCRGTAHHRRRCCPAAPRHPPPGRRTRRLGHASGLPRPPGDLDPVAGAELGLDVGEVALHRAQRDEQLARRSRRWCARGRRTARCPPRGRSAASPAHAAAGWACARRSAAGSAR